jgi:hypothetical protein
MDYLTILKLSIAFLSSKMLVPISIDVVDVNIGILVLIPCLPLSLRDPEHPLDTPLLYGDRDLSNDIHNDCCELSQQHQ